VVLVPLRVSSLKRSTVHGSFWSAFIGIVIGIGVVALDIFVLVSACMIF